MLPTCFLATTLIYTGNLQGFNQHHMKRLRAAPASWAAVASQSRGIWVARKTRELDLQKSSCNLQCLCLRWVETLYWPMLGKKMQKTTSNIELSAKVA